MTTDLLNCLLFLILRGEELDYAQEDVMPLV
jgi:hypothetical protein